AEMGHHLTIEGWATVVGLGEDDSFAALERAVGSSIDREEFEARYDAQDRSWRDQLPPLPGVARLAAELHGAGIALGVASSSSSRWVDVHLERLGLAGYFQVVATRDRVGGRTKPDPASYRHAVDRLGADPSCTVAIEDSAPGIAAAQGAGLTVVAVPSDITVHTDLTATPHHVASLEVVTATWLASLLPPAPTAGR
ncbi:MAG: HAD-IA family hydrolase, partial [Acidimicrobiales bacterium]|nr:HAD-IA family hydrolase [Acidimicrobiales bacterium]